MRPSRKDDLIDGAIRVFDQHGFHATGLDKLFSETGISRMTLYNHFESKDELIAAALRRRDERSRAALRAFVESIDDLTERILGVFDHTANWFASDEFHGCMFIKAAAEFADSSCAIASVAAESKSAEIANLRTLCEEAGLSDPAQLALQLHLLLEGAVVTAHVLCRNGEAAVSAEQAISTARAAARTLIDANRSGHPER